MPFCKRAVPRTKRNSHHGIMGLMVIPSEIERNDKDTETDVETGMKIKIRGRMCYEPRTVLDSWQAVSHQDIQQVFEVTEHIIHR